MADLDSSDVAVRRRAVMVLGKYRNPLAREGVIRCLEDEDSDVRRSALVSLSEQSLIPPRAQLTIVRLVLDPNIHVRRIASSMLPEVLLRRRTLFGMSGVRPSAGAKTGFSPRDDGEIAKLLNQALADEDVTVRKNILTLAPYRPGLLEREGLRACFSSPDQEVRILAIRAYATSPGDVGSVEVMLPLVTDPRAVVRREVARVLPRFGAPAVALLRSLATDSDASVRLQAVSGLVRLQDREAFSLLESVLRDELIPGDERRPLVPLLLFYERRAGPLLRDLASTTRPPLQTEAVRLLGNPRTGRTELSYFLELLNAGSGEVRAAAGMVLQRRAHELKPEQIRGLLDSEFPDVRELSVRLAGRLPPESAFQLLLDACLDDDAGVRCSALRALGRSAAPDRLEILTQSLEDPDPAVQKAAVDGLLALPSAESMVVLRDYLGRCEDPLVALRIQRLLMSRTPRGRAPGSVVPRTPRPAFPVRPGRRVPPGRRP